MEIEGRGEIIVALHPSEAPNTCANFVSLINESFYDGIIFHRYEPGFVVQGGDPLTKTLPLTDPSIGTGGPGYTIPFESNNLRNEKYSLAMARAQDLNSGGS
ncbi:MAG: peptidylprolyl isomerase, partial [Armatimonadota bacterium]